MLKRHKRVNSISTFRQQVSPPSSRVPPLLLVLEIYLQLVLMSLPAWLTTTKDPESGASTVAAASAISVASTAPQEMSTFTAQEKIELSKVHWILRFIYMGVAILLAACAAVGIQAANVSTSISTTSNSSSSGSNTWGTVFIGCYVFAFAILICCFEIGLSIITRCMSENFGFLYTISGRIIFLALVCGMCAKLFIFGYVMIAVIAVVLLVHTILLIRNPRLGEYTRQLHYYAGK